MTALDRAVERLLRMLPKGAAQRMLGRYFEWRFRTAPPCMVRHVSFVNYATFSGLPRNALDKWWGPPWGIVTEFGGKPYWLEVAETRKHVVEGLQRLIDAPGALPELVIDRSRVRGYGDPTPTHPAYHASFSLWRRMTDAELRRLEASEQRDADVRIAPVAYMFDHERL